MRHLVRFLTLLSALLLAGCNVRKLVESQVPPGADARSREYLELIRRGQLDSAHARLAPGPIQADAQAGLRQLEGLLRDRSLDSMQRIGVHVNTNGATGLRRIGLAYQVHDSLGWFVANILHVGRPGDDMRSWMIEGVRIQPTRGDLEAIHAFTLAGRGARHWLWVVAMVAAFLLSVATALHVGMSRGMPRRWLWVFVALLGVGRFSLDWTTGAWSFAPLQVMLFGAAYMRPSEFAPWIMSFAIPAGAIVAEWKRRAWLRGRAADAAQLVPAHEA